MTLSEFYAHNIERNKIAFNHDWDFPRWFTALSGEVGEVQNEVKKINRGDGNLESLGDELADCVSYLCFCMVDHTFAGTVGLKESGEWCISYLQSIIHFDILNESLCDFFTKLHPKDRVKYGYLISNEVLFACASVGITPTYKNIGLFIKLLLLLAKTFNINLEEACIRKFNAVSKRIGVDYFINTDGQKLEKLD